MGAGGGGGVPGVMVGWGNGVMGTGYLIGLIWPYLALFEPYKVRFSVRYVSYHSRTTRKVRFLPTIQL